MGISNTPTIYKSGLTIDDVKNACGEFIDISDKFNLILDPSEYNYFIVKYNPITRIVYCRVQIVRLLNDGVQNFATPKIDCPIKEISNFYSLRRDSSTYNVDSIMSFKNGYFYVYIPQGKIGTNLVNGQGVCICELV